MLEEATTKTVATPSAHVVEQSGENRRARKVTVRGIVLAGVHSWGDCVLEQAICRPLLPVASRPLITHALNSIQSAGIPAATICGNSDTAVLRRQLGNTVPANTLDLHAETEELAIADLALDYFEDVMPRGPAGCVRDAALKSDAEIFVVMDGTLVPRVDFDEIIEQHCKREAAITLVVAESNDGASHEPLGIYVISRKVLEGVPAVGYQDIKESLIPTLYRRGERVLTHVVQGAQSARVTDAASYLGVNIWATERAFHENKLPAGGRQMGDAWVDRAAHVDPTARFVGPVIVGPNVHIGPGALIVGPSTIGAGSRIFSDAVVSRSALWERCTVGTGAIVDQCVLADNARVEADYVVRETVCLPGRAAEPGRRGRLNS